MLTVFDVGGVASFQVPRQQLIQVDLLDKLPLGTADLQVPAEGMTVPHIRCNLSCTIFGTLIHTNNSNDVGSMLR